MADVVVRLKWVLASKNPCMVPSTEEEKEDDLSVGGSVYEQFGENAKRENTQGRNRSKGEWKNVTLHFRRFLVGSNIPRNFTSLAASGGNKAYMKGQILPTPNLRIFSFLELKNATKNFRKDRLVGEGGFGKVYKGWLYDKNGSGLILAVKKMNPESWQGFEEWQLSQHLTLPPVQLYLTSSPSKGTAVAWHQVMYPDAYIWKYDQDALLYQVTLVWQEQAKQQEIVKPIGRG
ncbi:hypothetical protein RHSIM_Rhsim10G0121600 [Rhododendron simsii]|uniref:Protein kinase domain-containing protein n=1 Tax=Rhododendron simsii TaxID=118357 RepID=A0A834GD51_RHOSS|nr:hypothetical protein RHSIM_Rhsim10G0121600 [Rhododendron simsii]